MPIDRITRFCFVASYAVALAIELLQLVRPRPVQKISATAFGAAGLLAHTLFLAVQQPTLASQHGSLLFLAWILAVFYLYGSMHHRNVAWAVFVLPVVLGLVTLTWAYPSESRLGAEQLDWLPVLNWGIIHIALLLLAAVGVCVGFVASLMYLVQAHRLRAKVVTGPGQRLLSLERLETMNRRAINLAFPLLTAGMLIGLALMLQPTSKLSGWTDPRVLASIILWLVFSLLIYLRYGVHLPGRRLAQITIVVFVLLMVTLAVSHS